MSDSDLGLLLNAFEDHAGESENSTNRHEKQSCTIEEQKQNPNLAKLHVAGSSMVLKLKNNCLNCCSKVFILILHQMFLNLIVK